MKKIITTVVLLSTLSSTYAQTNTFPTTGNVGIGTTTPIAKLDVIGGPSSAQTFINVQERNMKSVILNIGSIINSQNYRMFKLFDFPESNFDTKPFFYFALEDRKDMNRFRMIGQTDGYTNLILSNKRQEEIYNIFENGSDKVTVTLPKVDSYLGIGTSNPQSKLHVVFGGEPKSILFREESNTPSTMNSMIRFTWYNDTTDLGLIRSGDSRIEALAVRFNGAEVARFTPNGNFALKNKLEAKEVKVTTTPTADFVFAENYDLPKLEKVEKYIKEKKHLPEIASAKEMEKEGVNVGEFQIKLLQKIEELTLYTIEQNKQIKQQQEQIKQLESQNKGIAELKKMVQDLQTKK